MFDKFGEFDSAQEICELAEGLKAMGDLENLKALAKENGIDEMVAQLYMSGDMEVFCDNMMAAIGKLEVEAKELQPKEIMQDWLDYITSQCQKDDVAIAVRKKGKTLKGCIAELLEWSLKNSYPVDKEITQKVGIKYEVKLGIPGMGTAKRIIREYYLGK